MNFLITLYKTILLIVCIFFPVCGAPKWDCLILGSDQNPDKAAKCQKKDTPCQGTVFKSFPGTKYCQNKDCVCCVPHQGNIF